MNSPHDDFDAPSAPALTGLADFFTRWHCIHSNTSTTPSVAVSPVFAARLAEFFIAWAERPDALSTEPAMPEPLAIQLQRFAGAWRRLERPLEPRRSARVIDWTAQALELARFFQHLRPALQAQAEQRRLGSSINVWRTSGLGSDELRNSKVLAWLLDCRGTHGQGARILAALLDSVDRRVKDFPTSVATSLPQEYAEIEKAGFQFDPKKGTWFLPWKLDATLLAQNYANDAIDDSLGPLKDALGRIESLYPTFAKLVESAQQQFGANHDA